ncbi:hypothetical protein EMPS_01358 [Entomortierella parvispora]|uniref:Uncharacterized protein n=1 Tax=Entomortierella parvispora TaxID=205924 RepID=A0A9P3H2T6_9FUNG|nr:hypothetical protein EMPS_01358 [Entomortierella parvispora]
MTHLSDMSYLQRAVSMSWFYGWFVIYVYRWDRFEALRPRRLIRLELRSMVTLLTLIALCLQLAYDIGSARLKYLEGFWVNPQTDVIQSKPAQDWDRSDQIHVEPLYYTLACSMAFQNSVFFLLQAFWSYISKSVTKSTFMSSFEFKVNIVASCVVVVLFPTIQYLFRYDFVYREVVPQFIFSLLMFITGVLGIRTHFRLKVLTSTARDIMNETTINVVRKLEYFKDMNAILTFSFFGGSLALGILSADGLSPSPIIATNKFASDLLITNLNFFEFIIWVTLTLIFYPRKTGVCSAFGSSNNQSMPKSQSAKERQYPRFNEVQPKVEHPSVQHTRGASFHIVDGDKQEITEEAMVTSPPPSRPRSQQRAAMAIAIPPKVSTSIESPRSAEPISPVVIDSASISQGGKSGLETRTIYYLDSLVEAQQQQQPLEWSEAQAAYPTSHHQSLPNRSFSQPSLASGSGAVGSGDNHVRFSNMVGQLPNRSGSNNSDASSRHPNRSGSSSSQRPLLSESRSQAATPTEYVPSTKYVGGGQVIHRVTSLPAVPYRKQGHMPVIQQHQAYPMSQFHTSVFTTQRRQLPHHQEEEYPSPSLDDHLDGEVIRIAYGGSVGEGDYYDGAGHIPNRSTSRHF